MASVLPFLVAAVGFSVLAVNEAAHWPRDRLVESFNDDAFYYFEIAKNIATGLGSTFDGISKTNGYHPLWMATLVPVYWLDLDLFSSLVAVKVLSGLAWIVSIGLLFAIGRYADQTTSFAVVLVLLIYLRGYWFTGMESTVSLPLLLAAIYLIVSKSLLSSERRAYWLVACGWVVGLAVLARLDLVFFVLVLGVFVFLTASSEGFWPRCKDAALIGSPSLLLVSCYMVLNRAVFGTSSPVSGQAKSIGAPFLNLGVFSRYLDLHPISAPILRELTVLNFLLIIVVPALLLLRLRNSGTRRVLTRWSDSIAGALESVLYLLLLSNVVQLAYYAFSSSWPLWRWYYYYFPLILVLSVAVLISFFLEQIRDRQRLATVVNLTVCILMILMIGRSYRYSNELQEDPLLNYRTQSVEVAEYLNSHVPHDSVFAMGDRAGSLGYQLTASLVQTEGLVGSKEFLDALEEGNVHRILRKYGVDFVVYSGGPSSGGNPIPAPQSHSEDSCYSVNEPKFGSGPKFQTAVCDRDVVYDRELRDAGPMGGSYTIWRYRQDLNQPVSVLNQ